jgi:two-component system sensor histidine kinase/response regulator
MYLWLVVLIAISLVFFIAALTYYIRFKKLVEQNSGKENNDASQELNSLLNSLNDIIFEFNEDKVCLKVWFNDTTKRVIDPRLVVGKRLADIIGTEKAKKFDDALEYVIQTKKITSLEYISDFGTGEWFVATMTPVFDREGNYTSRISTSLTNISEQKKYAEALKENELSLTQAQAIAKIGNWNWNRAAGTVSWSNEIANIYELNKLEVSEYEALKLLIKYVDRHDKFILQYFLKSLIYDNNYSFVFRIATQSGSIKYLRIIVGKITAHENGSVQKIIGTLQDFTERREVEIAYKRTENKYKLVLETIKMVALSVNNQGIVTFCNQYLANLLGYEQKEILGRRWLDFIPEDTQEIIRGWYANNAIKPQHINSIVCRNGEQRIISWQNTVSYDENAQIQENTSIGEDITDQQRATLELISAKELAEKSSEFKSEFLSIMSHEIRTPMNAVIGTTNLLLSDDPKPEQLEYLNILKFSADNLLAIINDILDYNKIEAGKLELNIFKFNLHHLVQKIKKSFYSKATEKLLDIVLMMDDTIPEFIMGDQMRLSQILNNLVSNAVKFTQKGKVIIKVENEFIDDNVVTIKFTITDTGIGIANDNLLKIFDPFMQESQFINSHSGGTGLGLAITKRLIQLHQSDIQVVSELNKGTQFTFSISFDFIKPEGEQKLAINESGPKLNLLGMNILLVDDNKMNLLIAATFLKKWQANVEEAFDGQIAVDMVKVKQYDLIIMDLQMPVMDGFEATKIIKSFNPDLPIIALTADAMPETYNKALATGMSDYLTKPFVPNIFFEKISKYYKSVV